MKNKKKIFDDLNEKGTGFSVPASYLSNFDENFSKHLNRRLSGFKTPRSYFNNVENSIFEKVLESSKKKTGFSVPENYFKDIENRVHTKYENTKRPRVVDLFRNRYFRVLSISVAASLLLYLGITALSIQNNDYNYETLNVEEIEMWMDDDLISLSSYEIADAFEGVDLIAEDIYSDEDVIDYLEYENLDNVILEN